MDGTADGYRHGNHHDDIHLVDVQAQDGERCRHRGARSSIAGSFWLVRSQGAVYDVSYMKAIDPASFGWNHDQRTCSSPRVRKLADGFIEAQVREIADEIADRRSGSASRSE
jgi:hypothetical protein